MSNLKFVCPIMTLLSLSSLPSCYIAEHSQDHRMDDMDKVSIQTGKTSKPIPLNRSCARQYESLPLPDFSPSDVQNICQGEGCVPVPVTLTYLINEDIGHHNGAVVEAYDNPYFQGPPKASTTLYNFRPDVGSSQSSLLKLRPGSYYIRAYLNIDQPTSPYEYGDMVLVGDKPVGYYGATSTPKKLEVLSRKVTSCPSPINIQLDKLFKDPSLEPKTNARLRLKLSLSSRTPIEEHRQIHIELHETEDYQAVPKFSDNIPSESLLVFSRPGQTEWVSPHLPAGKYYVFVYIDEDNNDFFDPGEPFAQSERLNEKFPVTIKENRTETLNLTLR